jgi:hypothetical protein
MIDEQIRDSDVAVIESRPDARDARRWWRSCVATPRSRSSTGAGAGALQPANPRMAR